MWHRSDRRMKKSTHIDRQLSMINIHTPDRRDERACSNTNITSASSSWDITHFKDNGITWLWFDFTQTHALRFGWWPKNGRHERQKRWSLFFTLLCRRPFCWCGWFLCWNLRRKKFFSLRGRRTVHDEANDFCEQVEQKKDDNKNSNNKI